MPGGFNTNAVAIQLATNAKSRIFLVQSVRYYNNPISQDESSIGGHKKRKEVPLLRKNLSKIDRMSVIASVARPYTERGDLPHMWGF
jgi:hypothetical protein